MRVSRGAAFMIIEHASEIVKQMYDEHMFRGTIYQDQESVLLN